MSKIALKFSNVVGENFNFTDLKCLKLHLNSPPCLEEINFTDLKCLKLHLNSPPCLEEILILLISNV